MKNNFDIQLIKYDIQISRQDETATKSIYDVLLTAKVEYEEDESASNSTLAAGHSRTRAYSVGLSKKFSTGTKVGANHIAIFGGASGDLFQKVEQDIPRQIKALENEGTYPFGCLKRGGCDLYQHGALRPEIQKYMCDAIGRNVPEKNIAENKPQCPLS